MKVPAANLRQLAAGVLLGLAAGVGLIAWLAAAGRDHAGRSAAEQAAVVTLQAAADVVSAADAAGTSAQEALEGFVVGHPDLVLARVVDIKKRSLEASTEVADHGDGLPRRLDRKDPDHKVWYDLGQSLRAAADANRDEGRLWKELIQVERRDDGLLELATPLWDGDDVRGVVIVRAHGEPPALGGGRTSGAGLVVLGAAALFLAVGWPLRQRSGLLLAVASAVVLVALAGFGTVTLAGLDEAREEVEAKVGDRLVADAERVRGLDLGTAFDPGRWDADRFGEPRGLISTAGEVATERVAQAFATARGRFRNGFVASTALGFLVFAFVGLGGAVSTWRTLVRYREAYSFVTPAMIGMLVLVFFPFFFGITLSFTNQSLYNLNQPIYDIWVGFDNYVDILTDFEVVRETEEGVKSVNYENFYWNLWFTVAWTIVNVLIGVSVGMALALALNTKGLRFKAIYRVILILPWAVPNYITALIWKGMFHQQFGVVNQLVQILGGEPIAWFDHTFTSFCAVVATNGWLSFPFMMVVALGGLQSIPADLYEAAKIDGAGRWQQFLHVTLPSLKPVMVPAIILSVVWTFNMFNIIFLVSAGDPGGATEILITRAFKLFYEQYQYGYAAAYATVIFAILLAYGTWQNRVTRAYEGV